MGGLGPEIDHYSPHIDQTLTQTHQRTYYSFPPLQLNHLVLQPAHLHFQDPHHPLYLSYAPVRVAHTDPQAQWSTPPFALQVIALIGCRIPEVFDLITTSHRMISSIHQVTLLKIWTCALILFIHAPPCSFHL